jgi:hypothetical protein
MADKDRLAGEIEGTHKELRELLIRAYEMRLPVFVWGAPGIGKSDTFKHVARALAAKMGLKYSDNPKDWQGADDKFVLIDTRASQEDPSDIRGLPDLDKETGRTKYYVPNWMPDKGFGIILRDELNLAAPLVQASSYQLILDGRVGDYVLPGMEYKELAKAKSWWVVFAAGNRIEDRASVFEMPVPLQNRFLMFHLSPGSPSTWNEEWAAKNGVHGTIMAYLNFKPTMFHKIDPLSKEKTHCTARSWAMASKLIGKSENWMLARHAVGTGVAYELLAFAELTNEIDVDAVIAGKEKFPERADQAHSVLGAIVDRYRLNKKKLLKPICELSLKISPEYALILMKMVVNVDQTWAEKQLVENQQFRQLGRRMNKYLYPDRS